MRGTVKLSTEWLDSLVPQYVSVKADADKFKKAADDLNKNIKQVMTDNDLDKYSAGGFTVTKVVTNRETMDEQKLLQVARKHNIPAIKTVEVIDMDALENFLYHSDVTDELMEDLAKCKSKTEVVQLRVKEEKK